MKPRFARVNVAKQRNRMIVSVENQGGYFVHIRPDPSQHGKQRLVMRIGDQEAKTEIVLSGRQINSLRRVLDETIKSPRPKAKRK